MGSYPTTHQELWSRLLQFQFDEPGTALPFSRRLARENSWGQRHTIRVIQEYRRFLFLAMTAGHPVTPSVEVDQAWHLHLTYTRSYWDELCPKVLCGPLHHQPTKGGNKEGAKFQDWYARTLQSYQAAFGVAPPADIWPAPAVRLAAGSRIRQVSSRTHWVIRKPAVGGGGNCCWGDPAGLILTGCGGKSWADLGDHHSHPDDCWRGGCWRGEAGSQSTAQCPAHPGAANHIRRRWLRCRHRWLLVWQQQHNNRKRYRYFREPDRGER